MVRRREMALVMLLLATPCAGQAPAKPHLPILFDPDIHPATMDVGKVSSIRFLTTDDFPPFHFALPDGTPAGFDVDLVRAICADLKIACTIQARRFDMLIPQLKAGKDDAVIAAIADTTASRADLDFSAPYYTTPARFVTRVAEGKASKDRAPKSQAMDTPDLPPGASIGVEAATSHAAYLDAFFPQVEVKTYPTQMALRAALQAGKVDAIFGDGISLALWLNGTDSKGCCTFRGGPYTESRFFGDGMSIAVAKGNVSLRLTLDAELAKLTADGTYADLYLKYFPIGFY